MEQIPNSNSKSNPITPINMPTKTQMLILSPDILNKLGIASQISNLTRLAAENSNNKNVEEKNLLNAKNMLENEIKLRLSKTLNKSFERREDVNNKIINIEPSSSISLAAKNSNESGTIICQSNPRKNKIKINEIKIIKRGNIYPNIIQSQEQLIQSSPAANSDSSIESCRLRITPESEEVSPIEHNINSIVPKNLQEDFTATKNNLSINIKRSKRIESKKKVDQQKDEAAKSNKNAPKPIVISKNVKKIEEFPSFAINKPIKTYSRKLFHNIEIKDKKATVNVNIENDKIASGKTNEHEASVEIPPEKEPLIKAYSQITQVCKAPDNISSKNESSVKKNSNELCTENFVETLSKNKPIIKSYSRITQISKLPANTASSNNDDNMGDHSFKEICNERDYLHTDSSDISTEEFPSENKNPLIISFTEQSINSFDDNSLADIPIIFEDELMNYVGNNNLLSLEDSDISFEDSNIQLITVLPPEHNESISKNEIKVDESVELLSKNDGEGLAKDAEITKENHDEDSDKSLKDYNIKLNTVSSFEYTENISKHEIKRMVVDESVELLSKNIGEDRAVDGEITEVNNGEDSDKSLEDYNSKLNIVSSPGHINSISKQEIKSMEVDKSVELLSENGAEGLTKEVDITKENNDEVFDKKEEINKPNEIVKDVECKTKINMKEKLLDESDVENKTITKIDNGIIENFELSTENKSNEGEIDSNLQSNKNLQSKENTDNILDMPQEIDSKDNTDNRLNNKVADLSKENKNEEVLSVKKQYSKILQKKDETGAINKDIVSEKNYFRNEQNVGNMDESSMQISIQKGLIVDEENTEESLANNERGIQKKKAMKIDRNNDDKLQVISEFPEQRREDFILPANRAELEELDNNLVGGIGREESEESVEDSIGGNNYKLGKDIVKTTKEKIKKDNDDVRIEEEICIVNPTVQKEIMDTTNEECRKNTGDFVGTRKKISLKKLIKKEIKATNEEHRKDNDYDVRTGEELSVTNPVVEKERIKNTDVGTIEKINVNKPIKKEIVKTTNEKCRKDTDDVRIREEYSVKKLIKKEIVKESNEEYNKDNDYDLRTGEEINVTDPAVEKAIVNTTNEEFREDTDEVLGVTKEINVTQPSVKQSKISSECAVKIKEELNLSREDVIVPIKEVDEPSPLCTPTPRKRGRPPKNKGQMVSTVSPAIQSESSSTVDPLTPLPTTETPVRKRGRPPKNSTSKPVIVHHEIFIKEEHTFVDASSSSESTPINPRDRKRKLVDAENGFKVVKCAMVECGVCHAMINNSQWGYHLIKHNYLAWRVGEEAIDLNDRKSIERALFKAVKERKAVFICEFCGSKKKSVLGYLGHIELCQISDEERLMRRVECPICGKFFQPSSFKWHCKTHENESEIVPSDPINDAEIRGRRTAASKAASLIQNVCKAEDKDTPQFLNTKFYKKYPEINKLFSYIGISRKLEETYRKFGSITCKVRHCTHRTTSFKQLKCHVQKCPYLETDDFICSICLFISKDENEINEHVYVHRKNTDGDEFKCNDNEEDDNDHDIPEENYSDLEEIIRVKKTASAIKQAEINTPYYKVNFLASQRRIPRAIVCTYPLGIKHTLEFQQRNWCFKNLFSDFVCAKTNWKSIPKSEHFKYLPEKTQSMNVKTVLVTKKMPNLSNVDHIWKNFNLFESEIVDDSATIFCGGPVWALAWLPTPVTLKVDQYLAVSAQKTFQNNYKLSQSYVSEEMVQIWNFGCLDIDRALTFQPRLEFCVAHGHGNVWAMEWCPSGCYDEEDTEDPNVFRRMGLLALACSDGEIPIYAICFPNSLHLKTNETNIYRPQEHCRLVLQDPDEQKLGSWDYQVTKLSWSKGKGHDIIAAGYSSGMVSLWDLSAESPLLKSKENGITILKPFLCFQPHFAPITAIQLYSQDGGKRWMTTGAWDRNSFLWDLHDTRSAAFTFAKRGCVTDGVLMMNWICFFFSTDDLHSLLHNVSIIQNPRDFGYKGCPILTANSMVMGLSGSDWGNAIAQVSLAGELIAAFPKQMLISFDPDKGMKYKRILLGYSESIDITLTPEERLQVKTKKSYDNLLNKSPKPKPEKMLLQSVMGQKTEPYVEEPLYYEEASKQYGLIFCDINLLDQKNIPEESLLVVKQSTRMKEAPIELYPFFCNNKVQWNPNRQAYLYIATAMQSGFVRLRCIRFLNTKHTKISLF